VASFLRCIFLTLSLNHLLKALQQLLQLRIRILRVLNLVSNRPLITINLPVVSTRVRLITKEVDLIIHYAAPSLLLCKMVEAVCLVPTSGEHVEGDLSTDGVCEAEVGEGLLELGDHGGADVVLDVVGLVVIAFLDGGVTANGGHVNHAVAELDEGAALDRDIEVGDVVEDPANHTISVYSSLTLQTVVVVVMRRPIYQSAA
jgi:hypothetical protein